MARIPLTEQQFVKLPSIAVRTPQIDSTAGYAEMAAGVARFGEGVVKLFDKKQAADDLRFELDTDIELDAKALEFEQWKNQPENLNRSDNDFIPYWENHLEKNLIPPLQKRINESNVSAEAKYRAEQRLNNWNANMRTGVYSDAFKRTGEAFKGSLDNMRASAINRADPSKMDRYTEYVRDGISRGIFTEEQGSLMLEDASNVKNTIGQNAFKNNLENFINADQYELAYKQIDDAEKNGFINPNEAQNYRSNVKYRYEYSNKLDNAQTEAVEKPDEFLNKLNTKGTTVAAPVNAPAELSPYIASFQKYGEEYGIDPNFLMAVSMFETGNGKSSAFKNKNNATGISGATGPKTMSSVDESIRIAAKAISNYKANSVEGIGAIYSPPGASNDPNQTNAEWPSSVRAKYKELTGVELPKDYNPKKYSSTGFSPNDEFKLKNIAETSLSKMAKEQFDSLKQAVDIGQIQIGSATIPFRENPEKRVEEILSLPQFKQLNASPFKDIAKNYILKTPSTYEDTQVEIMKYDPSKDPSGLKIATLQTKIDNLFEGAYKDQLSKNLKQHSESAIVREQNKKLSPAFTLLNKMAFTDQALGKYKVAKTATVPEKKTWGGLPFISETIPAMEADIVTTPDVEVQLPDGTIKKLKGVPTPVEVVDPDERARIAELVEARKEELRKYSMENPTASSEDIIRYLSSLIGNSAKLSTKRPISATSAEERRIRAEKAARNLK